MRIIRYKAPDTRQALRGIREQLGDDAVILSSKRTPEGVELTAAVDFDATRLENEAMPLAPKPAAKPPAPVPATRAPAPIAVSVPAVAMPTPAPAASPAATAAMDNVNQELRILRRMLETQLEQLAWNERSRRTPVIAEMLRELTDMGISQELADRIVGQLPEQVDLARARRFAIAGLAQYLRTAGPRWQDEGGRVALVGATGAGKTTTLAKIAVRWVLRHGARDLALVAADPVRIGAQDQLHSLGQLLGAPVYAPDGFAGLPVLLAQLSRYRLVLIDTPGSSLRDPQLAARLAVLANASSKLESALVLPANSQAGAIEEAVKRFAPANPGCCLLTKVDEAASLGGALSVLIRARLAVAYVSGGQRVPEDLQPARALDLVSQAVQLAKSSQATAGADPDHRRFGRNSHGST
jgi:flagellar biosynthesis protein FlhF